MTEIRIGQLDLRDLSTSNLGSANAVANLESNIVSVATTVNTAINTVSANADTLTTLLNTVSGNIDAAASLVSTISGNADTFASLVTSFASYGNTNFVEGTYIDGEVANLIASAPTALNTLQELATAINNDAAFFDTITGLADTVNDNTSSIASNIDGIQSNLDSYATYANSQFGASSNISLTVGNTTISNTTIFVEGARSSVYANTNTTSKTLTFTHTMGNATSQEFTMNGSTNALTLGSTATSNTNMYFVFYNGLALKPDEYSISGTTMTLANVDPIISGSNVEVRYLDFFGFRETAAPTIITSHFGGENYGYHTFGDPLATGGEITKFSFTSDASATLVATQSSPTDKISGSSAGMSSSTKGYTAGGYISGVPGYKYIHSFSFTSDSEASPIGSLTLNRMKGAGHSSTTDGYISSENTPTISGIEKISFSSDGDSNPIGNLTSSRKSHAGHTSSSYGYASGGGPNSSTSDVIDKFPFSSDSNATDVGELAQGRYSATGQSSAEYGYNTAGSRAFPFLSSNSTKFPFTSDAPSVGVLGITESKIGATGQSSVDYGYTTGGRQLYTPSAVRSDKMDKFPFSSDSPASDIGELYRSSGYAAGQQY